MGADQGVGKQFVGYLDLMRRRGLLGVLQITGDVGDERVPDLRQPVGGLGFQRSLGPDGVLQRRAQLVPTIMLGESPQRLLSRVEFILLCRGFTAYRQGARGDEALERAAPSLLGKCR